MESSYISHKVIPAGEAVRVGDIREGIYHVLQKEHPGISAEHYISLAELNQYRRSYLASLVLNEEGELAKLDREVMEAIRNNEVLSEKIAEEREGDLTLGQQLADRIATFGGSWFFILSFFLFILIWMIANIWWLATRPFDPFPFILLNLILSCIAAIQAPIIMMSQNRQEQKDRKRSEHDYKINLKAELEIQLLNEKIDHLMVHQNKKLLEIQEMQIDYLEDLLREVQTNKPVNPS